MSKIEKSFFLFLNAINGYQRSCQPLVLCLNVFGWAHFCINNIIFWPNGVKRTFGVDKGSEMTRKMWSKLSKNYKSSESEQVAKNK